MSGASRWLEAKLSNGIAVSAQPTALDIRRFMFYPRVSVVAMHTHQPGNWMQREILILGHDSCLGVFRYAGMCTAQLMCGQIQADQSSAPRLLHLGRCSAALLPP